MKTLPLKRVALIIAGQSPPSEEVTPYDNELPFLQGNAEFGSKHPAPLLQCKTAPKIALPGDILVSVRAPVGALNVSDRKYGIGRGLAAIRCYTAVEPRYVWWALNAGVEELQARATGSTFTAVDADELGSLPIPAVAQNEQVAIADFLDSQTTQLDRSIEANLRLQALLGERREAITATGVSGLSIGLTASQSSVPWLEALPSAWPVAKLTLIARLGSGHTPSRSHPEWWQEASIPWITTGEVHQMRADRIEYISETRERISELGLANSSAHLHPKDTVVLCRTASAGFSAIMGLPMATSQDFVTWTCGPLLRPRYLLLCLRAMRQDLLGRLAMGSTHQTIYVPDIESIRVPLPPIAQQDHIVEATWSKLKQTDELVDHLAHQIELLHERRQALITAAVTGQISVLGAA